MVGLEHLRRSRLDPQASCGGGVLLRTGSALFNFRETGLQASTSPPRGVIVARFLAIALELYRRVRDLFEQAEPLNELRVEWTGSDFSDEDLSTLSGGDYDG